MFEVAGHGSHCSCLLFEEFEEGAELVYDVSQLEQCGEVLAVSSGYFVVPLVALRGGHGSAFGVLVIVGGSSVKAAVSEAFEGFGYDFGLKRLVL